MNKLNIIFSEQAYQDIELICNYISKDNHIAAKKLTNILIKSCDILAAFPDLGVKRLDLSNKNIMFFVVKRRYIIVYKIEKNNIYIIRILSSYQDIQALL